MKLMLFAVSLLAAITAASPVNVTVEEWNLFKAKHGKVYSESEGSVEEKFRMKIYIQNKALIDRHNHLASLGHYSYFLKMNQFGDLLHSEIFATLNGFPSKRSGATFIKPEGFEGPAEVDWRTKGAVTGVKSHNMCGVLGDWAFSATGSLEGQQFRKTGRLVPLSEQNLLDCSYGKKYENYGCAGGNVDKAFEYIRDNHGLDTESSYPFNQNQTRSRKLCKFDRASVGASVTGYVDLPKGDEEALAMAVAAHGPVSVTVDSSQPSILFYSHGIYDDAKCSSDNLISSMLVVGYGPDYWLLKNSWSTMWGMEGYIKMKRGRNMCGISEMASYPLV